VRSLSASIEDVIELLTSEFQSGLQYSTLNSARSALSATLPPFDGIPVGQHPLISRLLQGIFNYPNIKPLGIFKWLLHLLKTWEILVIYP
jgi:hypothetical protein